MTASVLGISGKLGAASHAAAFGKAAAARLLTNHALVDAHALTGNDKARAAALLNVANAKRLGIEALAAGKPAQKVIAKAKAKGAHADVVAAARAGRLRSNHAGDVSPAELLHAAKAGRVFWVQA
jgi:hypothetical protein